MNNYLDHYLKINDEFSKVMKESLEGDNIQKHARAGNFIDDYKKWISLLSNSYEVKIYEEALDEYNAMLLFWSMGLYKYAFMSLRGYLELTLFGIKLSVNELDFRLWRQGSLDLYWSSIIDDDNGIFSNKFIMAYNETLIDLGKKMRELSRAVYRECSEYIHSNYRKTSTLPDTTTFNQSIFDEVNNKVDAINQIIIFVFIVRYWEKIELDNKKDDFEDCVFENLGSLKIIQQLVK